MSSGPFESTTRGHGVSRRAALKAGVGVGVGVVAWTGPTITSLGGTPAYAAGCTFIIEIDLSGGCRNTDQGNCAKPTPEGVFGYHTLKDTGLPTGYSLTNNVAEGTCCTAGHAPVLHFPAGITCGATLRFALPGNCTGTLIEQVDIAPSSTGTLVIPLNCVPPPYPSQTQYTIVARCATTGAPMECLTP